MPYTDDGVGYQKTDTSHNAAEQVSAGTIRDYVLSYLHSQVGPQTSEEIAKGISLDYVSVQPRLSELRNMNLVRDSSTRKIGRLKLRRGGSLESHPLFR